MIGMYWYVDKYSREGKLTEIVMDAIVYFKDRYDLEPVMVTLNIPKFDPKTYEDAKILGADLVHDAGLQKNHLVVYTDGSVKS